MKRVVALFLSLSMIVTILGVMPIMASAEENTGDIIFEDFADGFVIDSTNNKITTTSGLTVTANEEFFTKGIKVKGGKSVYEGSSVTDSGLVIPALESNGTTRALIFSFDKVETGKVNISFDIMANSKQYSHAGSYGSIAQLNDDGTYATKMSNKIYNLNAISEALVFGNGGSTGYKVIAKNLNEYKRITHCVDMDAKTVTSYVNGELLMTQNFTANYINALVFDDNYNWGSETIDNLAVVKNPENHIKNVNFYNGTELVSTKQVEAGTSIAESDLPTVSKDGYYFNGYSRTNGGAAENISGFPIMEDTNLYASFVSPIIYEDFESTGFSVDSENNKITTDSGLSIDMRGTGYYMPAMSVQNGTMAIEQTKAGAPNGVYNNYLNINFGKINSGKTRVSFKFKIGNYAIWGNANSYFGNINDTKGYAIAAGTNTKIGFVKDPHRINVNNATEAPSVLTAANDNEWHTVVYDIDKDAGTYTFDWDGTNYGSYELTGDELSKLQFYTYTYGAASSNVYNYYIDDVCVIRDVDKNLAQKIRFIDGDTVVAEKSVNFMESLTSQDIPKGLGKEGYRFAGWSSENGSAVTEDLTNITIKNAMDFYAVYEKSVLYEDFTSTGFAVDKEAGTISSNSGFTYASIAPTSGFSSYLLDSMSIKDGALAVNHSSNKAATGNNDDVLRIGFNDITEGTAALSFRYKIDRTTPWGNGDATMGSIADKDGYRLLTKDTKSGYTKGNVGTTAPELLTSTISAWHTVEYKIDKDANIYYFVFDETSYGPYNLADSALSYIDFKTRNYKNSNVFNYTIDDIKLIKNPVTLTFTDRVSGEILATSVVSKDSYAKIPSVAGLTLSTDVDLSCVAGDMTVPCTVTASGDAYLENFEDFTIDYINKTVTTSSNFESITTGSAMSENTQIVEDSARGSKVLSVDWDKAGQTFSYNFPKATKGTVKVSFAISAVGGKADSLDFAKLAALTDSSTSKYAARMGYVSYNAVTGKYINNYVLFDGTDYVALGIGDSAWHNVTYYADLDNKSYYTEIDNKTFGPYSFNSSDMTGVDSIFFGANRDGWEGSYKLDDLKVEIIPTSNPSDTISGDYNGYGKTVVLNNKVITAASGTAIVNTSFVAKNGGYLQIGDTKLSGLLVFNENGELDVPLNSTAKLENGTNNGFLRKAELDGTEADYTVSLRATGTYNGSDVDKTADVTFDFKGISVKGNTLFKLIVQNVPDGISVDAVE